VPHTDSELVIRVVAMPEATNPPGDIFGGWLLSQMDLAAWICARRRTPHRLATVALDNVVLHKPVFVGDCLLCYARVERVGRTSITIDVEALSSGWRAAPSSRSPRAASRSLRLARTAVRCRSSRSCPATNRVARP
jgi:acyl-CoA thioesterase YciA